MSEWTATAIFGTVMGAQAAMIAFGRAGVPALVGGMHDRLDGYTAAMALITVLLAVSVLLVYFSASASRSTCSGSGLPGKRISSSQPASANSRTRAFTASASVRALPAIMPAISSPRKA